MREYMPQGTTGKKLGQQQLCKAFVVGPKPKPQETKINKGKNIDLIVEDELEGTRASSTLTSQRSSNRHCAP